MKSPIRGKIYSKFEKRGRGRKHMGIPVNDKVTPWPLETSFGVICHFIYKKFGNPSVEIDDEIPVI